MIRMNLASPSEVKTWCIENGFHPNRVLGQNFLIDRNVISAIAAAAGIDVSLGSRCLEVGPGLGALTEELLRLGYDVTAIEKDPPLAVRLSAALGNPERLHVREGDALDIIAAGEADGFPTMVSNLPYQAGTRILLELIRRIDANPTAAPETIVVLVQTEVAERLAAGPGTKVRGLAGVWAQLDYEVKVIRKVAASCFWPRPEVGSSVVRLVRHHRNDALGLVTRRIFRMITKRAFEHRRKQLGAIFRGIVESTARAEQLENEDWLSLASAWPQQAESAVEVIDSGE